MEPKSTMNKTRERKKYNLLMSHQDHYWDNGVATWDVDRYLEHTNEGVVAEFKAMTKEVVEQLTKMPTLFAYEKGFFVLASG
jgi:hypothetical protein